MRAAVSYGAGEPLVVEEIDVSPPGAGEVLVQVGACAICQSDLHYLSGAWPTETFPMICGHEVAGTVAERGAGVTALREGDRVIVSLVRDCGRCRYCKAGHPYLCEGTFPIDTETRLRNRAGRRIHQGLRTGGFAEQVLVHHSQTVAIPDDVPLEHAGLLACGVLTGYGAVVNAARMEPGRTAAVIGIGGVGINCVQGAAIAGARTLIAIDVEPSKFALALALGATHVLNPKDGGVVEAVAEITGGVGVDYVFVAAGSAEAVELGGAVLAKLGCMVVASMPPSGVTVSLKPDSLVSKNQTFIGTKMGSVRLPKDVPHLIGLYREGRLKLAELIADRYPLAEINRALDTAGQGAAARNVIVFD